MDKLTTREKQVLTEIIKDCKTSDQDIARKLKTSRPTIVKIRKRLEDKGFLKGYIPLIDFKKLGLTIHTIILYRWRDYSKTEELEHIINFIKAQPEVLLFIKGEGLGSKTDLIICMHKDLIEYETFIRRLKYEWKNNVENVEVFISSVDGMFKSYDLGSVALNALQERVIKTR